MAATLRATCRLRDEPAVVGEVKIKVKFTLVQAKKTHRGIRGIALLFL
jgi:hypothetical protein